MTGFTGCVDAGRRMGALTTAQGGLGMPGAAQLVQPVIRDR
jgi:hypothetical protein